MQFIRRSKEAFCSGTRAAYNLAFLTCVFTFGVVADYALMNVVSFVSVFAVELPWLAAFVLFGRSPNILTWCSIVCCTWASYFIFFSLLGWLHVWCFSKVGGPKRGQAAMTLAIASTIVFFPIAFVIFDCDQAQVKFETIKAVGRYVNWLPPLLTSFYSIGLNFSVKPLALAIACGAVVRIYVALVICGVLLPPSFLFTMFNKYYKLLKASPGAS